MRSTNHPPTNHRAAWGTIMLTMILLQLSPGADSHLPPRAKSVAEKFQTYEQTATPEQIATKRDQVIAYLRTVLKTEAAKANLDGALAVKSLIESLSKVPAKKPANAEGLKTTSFSINTEAKRRLEFQFQIWKTSAKKTVHCEIDGASDDTGDKGLQYELINPSGKVVKKGKLNSQANDIVSHQTRTDGTWKLALIDSDTEFEGSYPGNNGTISVKIESRKSRTQPALASTRPAS